MQRDKAQAYIFYVFIAFGISSSRLLDRRELQYAYIDVLSVSGQMAYSVHPSFRYS
jgi:hypothetical protein